MFATYPRRRVATSLGAVALVALMTMALTGCQTTPSASTTSGGHRIVAVASIDAWGSILAQLGGDRVQTTSIITNPDTDPHDYEPTPANGRTIAEASLVVENGAGYDSWMAKSVQANGNGATRVVDVATLVGTPAGGNPHQWYSPAYVERVANAITTQLTALDPSAADYFEQRRHTFETTGLGTYHRLIAEVEKTYAGTPVGASESIFAPLSSALGLTLRTPATFLKAISEGTDPSAADKVTIDRQISTKAIRVYVLNSQNQTPDVAAQVKAARARGIPVTTVTETLSPAGATFQSWQVAQLRALAAALRKATAR